MPGFGEELQPIDFPLIGNSVAVGIFSLLHIVLASLSVGFMVMAPVFEWLGRSNRFYTDLAYALTRFTLVVFSASAVLAVIMVELFIGLFPVTTMWIFNQFRFPIFLGVAAFFIQLFALYPYYHYWESIRRRNLPLHLFIGALAAFFVLVWVVVLDGMGSYMLTPSYEKGRWADLFNPTWVPLVLHRLFGNFVFAGYAISGYAGWRLGRRKEHQDEPYYLFLVKIGFLIGFAALLIQPFTGLFYATEIQGAAPKAYEQIIQGRYRGWVYLQFILIALLFLGSHLWMRSTGLQKRGFIIEWAFWISAVLMIAFVELPILRRLFTFTLVGLSLFYLCCWRGAFGATEGEVLNRAPVRRLAILLGLASLLTYLTMGVIRETARRPDTVRGFISLYDEARPQALTREEQTPGHGGSADPKQP